MQRLPVLSSVEGSQHGHLFFTSLLTFGPMRTKAYRGHRIELESEARRSGEWMARVTIVFKENDKEKRIPIFGRRQMTFDTQARADSYGLELAKLWIDGKLWGANGHG